MKILDIVRSLLPHGTDGRAFKQIAPGTYLPARNNVHLCPIWPPDIFAVTGTIIERSGCYTAVGPNRGDLAKHRGYLEEIDSTVAAWTQSYKGLFVVPKPIRVRWTRVIRDFGSVDMGDVVDVPKLVDDLVFLFCASDEACKGIGWDTPSARQNPFVQMALASFVKESSVSKEVPTLSNAPHSLCALVPPSAAVVMPKTLTATVGCTIRSLSHHLALLPGASQCKAHWALATDTRLDSGSKPIRLLVIPFPFDLPNDSFRVSSDPVQLTKKSKTAAFFELEANWLKSRGKPITPTQLYNDLILPLLNQANEDPRGGGPVTGVIFPECALTDSVADGVAERLARAGVSFFTTGILRKDRRTKQSRNVAKTYVLHKRRSAYVLDQYKHHRWRLDRDQCDTYGLDFQWTSVADKWWEDIDVSERQLPIFALRDAMSMTVMICEDLARNDPAMALVRAVGPNLVIALLMDGPQLNGRWPGKYATVLGEDPGSGVLSVTCAALMDRSNENWSGIKRRVIALWRSEGTAGKEIELPEGCHAVVLEINSRKVEQHTLDNRTDDFGSRKLSLGRRKALKLPTVPQWL
jgi:hypothetical protein